MCASLQIEACDVSEVQARLADALSRGRHLDEQLQEAVADARRAGDGLQAERARATQMGAQLSQLHELAEVRACRATALLCAAVGSHVSEIKISFGHRIGVSNFQDQTMMHKTLPDTPQLNRARSSSSLL